MKFHNQLINWYLPNARELPWRKTRDPYRIWLSEIMLQQTRIAQGLPYYEKFVAAFPSVFELANASEEQVLKLWQGLGYYSRARNLHFTAKYIANELNGVFPKTYLELKKLKGVGEYTAAAIASFCYDEPVAVLDGNVFRVLARYFGIATPINSTEGKKEFRALAEKLIDVKNPATYNQAIMEFGALHCKPKNPLCLVCPFQPDCVAFQQSKVAELPVKLKKAKVRTRQFNYLVFINNGEETLLQQRIENGIWKNLYEFPLVETEKEQFKENFSEGEEIQHLLGEAAKNLQLYNIKPIKHVLSHQKLMIKFWILETENFPLKKFTKEFTLANAESINDYPVPVVLAKFIERFDFSN